MEDKKTDNILNKAKCYDSIQKRVYKLKPILLKRKSAFTIWEWLQIKELFKINE